MVNIGVEGIKEWQGQFDGSDTIDILRTEQGSNLCDLLLFQKQKVSSKILRKRYSFLPLANS